MRSLIGSLVVVLCSVVAAAGCGDSGSSSTSGGSGPGGGGAGGNGAGGAGAAGAAGGNGGNGGDGGAGGGPVVPAGWTCEPSYYDEVGNMVDPAFCDCNCGVVDPDCSDTTLPVGDCAEGQTCNTAEFTCEGAPTSWTDAGCMATDYDAGAANGCQCDCGSRDPDCDLVGVTESGCDAGQSCIASLAGACYTPIAGWTCDPAFLGSEDGCDCGCGIADTDCADALVETCAFCNDLGACQDAACPGTINPTNNAVCTP